MSPYDPLGAVVPVAHPHYCVHGQQIGWHLAVDPQTVIDHKFCAPCRKCEQGIPAEQTALLPHLTLRELGVIRAALRLYVERHTEMARQIGVDSAARRDLVTIARSLMTAVDEATLSLGTSDE